MPSKPATVSQYLASLPDERRRMVDAIRQVIRKNIDPEFEEGIQYGMLGWYLPHSKYPAGYHCDPAQPLPFASIGSQKNHVGLYLFCLYGNIGEEARFRQAWKKAGKRLDMGKSCVRVKRLEDVPLDVIGQAFKRVNATKFLKHYEAAVASSKTGARKKAAAQPSAVKKTVVKTASAKKAAPKKTAAKTAAPRKTAGRKAAPKKAAAKTAGRKAAPRKTAAKRATRKVAPKKAAAKTATRKVAPKKTAAKTAAPKKTAGRKAASKAKSAR